MYESISSLFSNHIYGGSLFSLYIGFLIWRLQLRGQRQFKVAEEMLYALDVVKNAIDYIRSPMSYEGEAIQERPNENKAEKFRRETYSPILTRLQTTSDKFKELGRYKITSKYLFSEDVSNSIETILKMRHKIWVSAMMLATGELSSKDKQKFEKDIWYVDGSNDEIQKNLQDSYSKIEKDLSKYLKRKSCLWPI